MKLPGLSNVGHVVDVEFAHQAGAKYVAWCAEHEISALFKERRMAWPKIHYFMIFRCESDLIMFQLAKDSINI